jgi:hypothetical protein
MTVTGASRVGAALQIAINRQSLEASQTKDFGDTTLVGKTLIPI